MAISFAAMENQRISGLSSKRALFFSKITGNEYLRLLCNARNIEQQDLTEKYFDLPLNEYAIKYSTDEKKNWH
jgi:ABC-2 type transport system ATP-binding protein